MNLFGNSKKKQLNFEYIPDAKNPITENIDENVDKIKSVLENCNDIVFRDFKIGGVEGRRAFLFYVDGLADKVLINDFVLEPLMLISRQVSPSYEQIKNFLVDAVKSSALAVAEIREVETLEEALMAALSGDTALMMDKHNKAIIISSRAWPARGTSEPTSETVIRGPRDGFVETIRMNTALIRRRIRDPRLKVKQTQLGVRSQTDIAILYIDDIVDKRVLDELDKKLKKVNIDAILDSGYLQEFLENRNITPLPQVQVTERPDVVAAALYEGRVGILVDNSPFALIIPVTMTAYLQSPEDYYARPMIATLSRWIRVFAMLVAIIAPSLYIAIVSFHPDIIPSKLAISIAATRATVPFPAFIEAIIMEVTFELIREAGIRLPRPIGSTIGIVGGLVIGQAAVSAGIVGPFMVIVVAITAIASFAVPSHEITAAVRILRFIFIIGASIYGLYGIMLVGICFSIHLVSLKSFGVPVMAPWAPFEWKDFKDGLLMRISMKYMKRRPEHYGPRDIIRQGGNKDDSQ